MDEILQYHDFLSIMMCAEGTTTNGSYLLPFKTGAFLARIPVQPIILKYRYRRLSPAWDTISGVNIFSPFAIICLHIFVHLYIYMCMYVHVCLCTCVLLLLYVYLSLCISTYMCMHVYVHVYVFVCTCVCVGCN